MNSTGCIGGGDHSTCSDTYKDDENCWFDDNCRKVVNMYCKEITVHKG